MQNLWRSLRMVSRFVPTFCCMVLTTPGIPGKLKEFWNFLPGPWKSLGKTDISLYSWNTPEIFWKNISSVLYTNQNLQKHLNLIVLFVFYVDSISVAATVEEMTWYRLVIIIVSFTIIKLSSHHHYSLHNQQHKHDLHNLIILDRGKITDSLPWRTPGNMIFITWSSWIGAK